jgi:CRP-like cAMP-binding protein
MKLAMEVHKQVYHEINFFQNKPKSFIAWVTPMLIQMDIPKDQHVFLEGDVVNFIYFILKGESGFVLPRYDNAIYILVTQGDYFGVIDLIPYKEEFGKKVRIKKKNWDLKRQFTV